LRILRGCLASAAVFCTWVGTVGAQAHWVLPSKPQLELKQYADSLPLAKPIGAAMLSDGSVLVADEGLFAVMRFAKDGTPLSTFGRRGSGPAEFLSMVWMGECERGRFYVRDAAQRRIAVVDTFGRYVRTLITTFPGKAIPSPYSAKCASSGLVALVGWPKADPPPDPGPHRGLAPVAVSRGIGGEQMVLGDFVGPERYRHARSDGPRPLGNTLEVAVSSRHVFVGTTDSLAIEIYDQTGRRVGSIRRSGAGRRITKELRDAFVEQTTEHLYGARRQKQRAGYAALAYPAFAPAYVQLLTDDLDRLWAEEYTFSLDRVKRLWCYGVQGQLLGTLTVPTQFAPLQITKRHVVGRWTDGDGTESVRVYEWAGSQVKRD